MTDPGTILVIGVGPGTGEALIRRFAAAGLNVVMVARKLDHIAPWRKRLRPLGLRP